MSNEHHRQWRLESSSKPGRQDWGLLVLPFKGWRVLENYVPAEAFGENCLVLLKSGANPDHPQDGDIWVLAGAAAEAWHRQNVE